MRSEESGWNFRYRHKQLDFHPFNAFNEIAYANAEYHIAWDDEKNQSSCHNRLVMSVSQSVSWRVIMARYRETPHWGWEDRTSDQNSPQNYLLCGIAVMIIVDSWCSHTVRFYKININSQHVSWNSRYYVGIVAPSARRLNGWRFTCRLTIK